MNYFMVFYDQDVPYFGFVTKDYWEQEQCLDDQGFRSNVPIGFYEIGESQYEYSGSVDKAVELLVNEGWIWIPNPF